MSKSSILKICKNFRFFFAVLLIIAGLSAVSFAEDSLTIVTVNTNRILEKYPPFLEAQNEFQKEQQKLQKRLQEMDEDEQRMGQQMIQQQLQQLGVRLEAEATQSLQEDIGNIAEEKGYDYVMDENVLFAGARDVTEEILEELDIEEGASTPGGNAPAGIGIE
ncbi:MAG: OmpH family outer membrane protein [Elusimicrobiota bacterium]